MADTLQCVVKASNQAYEGVDYCETCVCLALTLLHSSMKLTRKARLFEAIGRINAVLTAAEYASMVPANRLDDMT